MRPKDEIKDVLKHKYEGYQVTLPGGDWNEFKEKFDQKNKKRTQVKRYLYTLLAIFVVTLIGLTSVFISQDKTTKTTQKPTSGLEKQTLTIQPNQIHKKIPFSGLKEKRAYISADGSGKDQENQSISIKENQIKPTSEIVKKEDKSNKEDEVVNAIPIEKPASLLPDKPKEQITELNKQVKADTTHIAFKDNKDKKTEAIVTNISKKDSLITPKEKEKKSSNSPKIACKIIFSPDYTFRKFSANSAPKIHEDYNLIRTKSEKGDISFSLGVNLEFFVMKNLSVTSGLFYDKFSTGGKYDFYNNKIPVIDSVSGIIKGYITLNDTVGVHYSINNSYHFLELPLIMNYYIPLSNKWKLNLKAGGSMLYYMSSSGKTITADELVLKDVNTYSYNTINWGLILGLGCYYRLSDKINIGLEPTYKQFLGSLMKNDQLTAMKPWSVGVNANVQIILK